MKTRNIIASKIIKLIYEAWLALEFINWFVTDDPFNWFCLYAGFPTVLILHILFSYRAYVRTLKKYKPFKRFGIFNRDI